MAEDEAMGRKLREAMAYVRRRMPALEAGERTSHPVAHSVASCEANVIMNRGVCPPIAVGVRDGEVAFQKEVPRRVEGFEIAEGLYQLMLSEDCDYAFFGWISGPEAHSIADSINVLVQERHHCTLGEARVYCHKRKYSFGTYAWQHLEPAGPVPQREDSLPPHARGPGGRGPVRSGSEGPDNDLVSG